MNIKYLAECIVDSNTQVGRREFSTYIERLIWADISPLLDAFSLLFALKEKRKKTRNAAYDREVKKQYEKCKNMLNNLEQQNDEFKKRNRRNTV